MRTILEYLPRLIVKGFTKVVLWLTRQNYKYNALKKMAQAGAEANKATDELRVVFNKLDNGSSKGK